MAAVAMMINSLFFLSKIKYPNEGEIYLSGFIFRKYNKALQEHNMFCIKKIQNLHAYETN